MFSKKKKIKVYKNEMSTTTLNAIQEVYNVWENTMPFLF